MPRRAALALWLGAWCGACTAAELSSSPGREVAAVEGDDAAADGAADLSDAAAPLPVADAASDPVLEPAPDTAPAGDPDLAADPIDTPSADLTADLDEGPEPVDEPVVDLEPEPDLGVPAACSRDGARDCSPGPGETACDLDVGPLFGRTVNEAIDAVIAAHPDWFDTSQYGMPSPGVVLGMGGDYVRAVADEVTARGLCAIQDPNASAGNEMGVKLNNACAESYNILTSWGQVRRPPGAHIATCWPGWF